MLWSVCNVVIKPTIGKPLSVFTMGLLEMSFPVRCIGTVVAFGYGHVNRGKPKWNIKCAIGIILIGYVVTTSLNSTYTISTLRTGSRENIRFLSRGQEAEHIVLEKNTVKSTIILLLN